MWFRWIGPAHDRFQGIPSISRHGSGMLNDLWLMVSCLLVFIGLVASQGLLLIVGSLVIIIWLVAKFWDRFAFRGVSHSRSLSAQKAFIGDTLEYTITLVNEKLLPLIWVDIQDTFPAGLELPGARVRGTGVEVDKQHHIVTSLLPYQKVSWKYKLHCQRRGYHRIGPARVRSGDLFGFTAAEANLPDVIEILVYPRVIELPHLILPSQHPLGESKGPRPLFQDPSRFLGLRDYHPTDPMKHIDWKATARRSQLQTRVFDPVVSLNLLIALNATTSEHAWQGSNRRLFERAVTVAASVAKRADDLGFTFGLLSNSMAVYTGKWLSVPFGSSESQLSLVLESLAMAGPYAVTPLVDVLRGERSSLPPGATVALVTAVMTRALIQEIEEIRARGYRVLALYAGDGGPEYDVPGTPTYIMGRALQALDQYEPVFED